MTEGKHASAGDWDFYFLNVDDQPASIMVDLSLARSAPQIERPNMAYVRIYMQNARPDGLSSNEEFEALAELGDVLVDSVGGNSPSIYAGRNTSSGTRDFYFYTADQGKFEQSVTDAMIAFPGYEFETGGRRDAEWQVYFEFLHPSPDDLQRILNRRVKEALADRGDDPEKIRSIDHFAYLHDEESAGLLKNSLEADGFSVEEPSVSEGSVILSFRRDDCPAEIDDVVLPLARRIVELGGDYDGWGCDVEK